MNDILNSTAFREFLQKRVEEINSVDEEHRVLDSKLVRLDEQIHNTVSKEAYKLFLEYENLSIQQENNIANRIIYEIKHALL